MGKKLDLKKIMDSKASFTFKLDPQNNIDQNFILNNTLRELFEGYVLLTNPELVGVELAAFQEGLKQDIIEYFEDYSVEYSLNSLCGIAFFRLNKVSNQYTISKSFGVEKEKLEQIKLKANSIKSEYDLLSILR